MSTRSLELKPGATIQINLRKGEFLRYPYENLWGYSSQCDSIQGTIIHISAVSIMIHPLEERYTRDAYAVFLATRHASRELYNLDPADIVSEVRKRAMVVQNILFAAIESLMPLEP